MMRHRMYHVIGYIKTHSLLVFILMLGVASSVIGVGIILSANNQYGERHIG